LGFNGSHITKILKYKKANLPIRRLVEKEYVKKLKDLVDDYKKYHNAQPTSLFLNEPGIYALLIRSKKSTARKFYKWTIEEVLPSIRVKGYYELEKKQKIKVSKLNKKIKILENDNKVKEENVNNLNQRIKILENNQSKKPISKGKYIYIIKLADGKPISMDTTEIYKMGKTIKFNSRMGTINTSHKDDVLILYRVEVDDITAVENCLKGMLSKQLYRSNREHYIITLNEAIKMIKKCIKLTQSKLISQDKFYKKHIAKISRLKKDIFEQKIDFMLEDDNDDNNNNNNNNDNNNNNNNNDDNDNDNNNDNNNNNDKSKDNIQEQKGGYIVNNYNDILKLYKLHKKIFKIFDYI
jgi:prophage antirepressor-like protein